MLVCSVFASVVNFIRRIDPLLMIIILLALFIVGFLVLRKAIKVNYNPKKLDSVNLAWLMLALIIFAVAIFMVTFYV